MIVILTVICGLGGTLLGYFWAKPTYKVTCNVILSVETTRSDDKDNSSLAKAFMPTVADLIKTPKVISAAKGVSGDDGISLGALTIDYETTSLIFKISYSDTDQAAAAKRLADVIEAAKTELTTSTEKPINVKSMGFTETQNTYKVTTTNKMGLYIFAGFVIGFAAGIIVAILIYILDNKVKDGSELEELTNTDVIAIIEKQDD